MRRLPLLIAFLACFSASAQPADPSRTYDCYRTAGRIRIDGRLDEPDWRSVPASEPFADIRGVDFRPAPVKETRMKMLWDDRFLYVAGILEEDDVTASLKERDAIIYRDNDFEVFLDPDGDGRFYFEFECNAFGTLMDLIMDRPYIEGGDFFLPWDCKGVKVAVHVDGKVNSSRKADKGWTVEMAIPFESLAIGFDSPRKHNPWRVNFSRVEWLKKEEPENWVWNPTGKVNMHLPDRWGYLNFVDAPVSAFSARNGR